MTKRFLAILFAVAFCHSAGVSAQTLEPDIDVSAAARIAEVARAAVARRLTANGTWATDDGSVAGTWELMRELSVGANGNWSGVIIVKDFAIKSEVSNKLQGAISDQGVQFEVVSEDTEGLRPSSAFSGAVRGQVRGVQIEGTFVNPRGVSGRWSGFWHAWKTVDSIGRPSDSLPLSAETE